MSVSNAIEDELFRLLELKSSDNWASSTRTADHYDLVKRQYQFGERLVYVPKQSGRYVDLQSSRSIGISIGDDVAAILDKSQAGIMDLHEHDMIRIEELEKHGVMPNSGFAEIGFRLPRLMKHYTGRYGVPSIGYDVVPLSVLVSQHFGYDVKLHDVSNIDDPIDLANRDLVVCYHVLEHTSDPLLVTKKLFAAMDDGAYLHVEVPIEPGVPRLKSAHLFAFERGDLRSMLEVTGFQIISVSSKTHMNGPAIERYLCQKPKPVSFDW